MLWREVEKFYQRTKIFTELVELRNLVAVGHLIVKSAMARHESRGLHWNSDYPEKLRKAEDTIRFASTPEKNIK